MRLTGITASRLTNLDVRDIGFGRYAQETVVCEADRVLERINLMLLLRIQESDGLQDNRQPTRRGSIIRSRPLLRRETNLLEFARKKENLKPEDRPLAARVEVTLAKPIHKAAHIAQAVLFAPTSFGGLDIAHSVFTDESKLEPEPVLGCPGNANVLANVDAANKAVERLLVRVSRLPRWE